MNIKDLQPGSYQIIDNPTNINQLKPGSYTNIDQSQASLAQSQRLADMQRQSEEANKQAQQAESPLGIAGETLKQTGKGLLDIPRQMGKSLIAKPAIRFGQALVGGVGALMGGATGQKLQEATNRPVDVPIFGEVEPQKAFGQGGGTQIAGQAVESAINILPETKAGGALIGATAKALGGAGKQALKEGEKAVGVVGQYLAKRAEKKATDTALRSVTPKTKDLTTTEYEALLSKKRITPKSGFKAPEYILSDREKLAASKYKDILQDKDPVKNTINIRNRIAQEDADVGAFLEKNNGIFNSGELKNFISKEMEDVSDVMVPEERIAKLKDQITTNFLNALKKNDMKSLWEGRKEFDQAIENAFSGSPTLQKEVKKKFRNAIQEYISENTPDGVYKTKMKDMTDLFNLEDVVQTKASKEKGLNALQVWIKENPTKAKVIGAGAGVAGGGYLWNLAQ